MKCVDTKKLYMVSNKLIDIGLRNYIELLLFLVSFLVITIWVCLVDYEYTPNFLISSTYPLEVHVYSDVDWDNNPNNRKSPIGLCIFLEDSLTSCKSKKFDVVSCSSTKTKYHVMVMTTYNTMTSCRYRCFFSQSTPLYCDNNIIMTFPCQLTSKFR